MAVGNVDCRRNGSTVNTAVDPNVFLGLDSAPTKNVFLFPEIQFRIDIKKLLLSSFQNFFVNYVDVKYFTPTSFILRILTQFSSQVS